MRSPRRSIRGSNRTIRLTREDTVASNRGIIAAALLLGTALVAALPGASLEAAGAGSEAEPRAIVPPDTSPAQTDRFFHVEWSAGVAARGQSRIVGYVYNDYREDAVNVQLRISQLDQSGRPVDSIVQPVGDTVRAGGRAFFELRVPGEGPSYRVAVASFAFATDSEWRTLTTEQLLAAAGFEKKVADSPVCPSRDAHASAKTGRPPAGWSSLLRVRGPRDVQVPVCRDCGAVPARARKAPGE
jgi:hypothetical protein